MAEVVVFMFVLPLDKKYMVIKTHFYNHVFFLKFQVFAKFEAILENRSDFDQYLSWKSGFCAD